MKGVLVDSVWILAFAIAPTLLLLRFFRPRVMPRWAVVVLAALLGGGALYLDELVQRAAMMQQIGPVALPAPPELEGMVVLQGPGKTEFMLGALLQLTYLLLLLVPYGVTRIVLDRRKQASHVAA